MKRILTRFLWADVTPGGTPIPAAFGPIPLAVAIMLPVHVLVAIDLGTWVGVLWHLLLLLFSTILTKWGRDFFLDGLSVGREELVDEMIAAWAEQGVAPDEYLHREVFFDADLVSDARRQVHGSAPRRRRRRGDTP